MLAGDWLLMHDETVGTHRFENYFYSNSFQRRGARDGGERTTRTNVCLTMFKALQVKRNVKTTCLNGRVCGSGYPSSCLTMSKKNGRSTVGERVAYSNESTKEEAIRTIIPRAFYSGTTNLLTRNVASFLDKAA